MTLNSENIDSLEIKPSLSADLLKMSITGVILKVALPATLTFMMNMLFHLIDAFWVGKLGAEAMAALSAAGMFTWILYSIGSLGQVGVQALVSQSVGAGEDRTAKNSIMAGLILHIVVAILILIPIYYFRYKIFSLLGLEKAVLLGCIEYLVPFCFGMGFFFLSMVATSAFYALGDTKTPAIVLGTSLFINAILDPLLILGWGPFPQLGLFGAGVATAIAKIANTIWIIVLLKKRGLLTRDVFGDMERCFRLVLKVASLGSPIAANGVLFGGVYMVLVKILSYFGTVPIASLGIAHRIEGVAWFTCVGFSIGAAALAGQLTGAGYKDRAVSAIWGITLRLSIIMVGISLIYIFFGAKITRIFINDPFVITEGGRYLLIIGFFEIFMAWEVVFSEVMGAVGSPSSSFLIGTPISLMRIPFAWFFAIHLGMGVTAVWWVIALTTLAKGVALATVFSFGPWRKKGSLIERMV